MLFQDDLIPFGVISGRPAGGFLKLITDTLAAGQIVHTFRTVTTSSNPTASERKGSQPT